MHDFTLDNTDFVNMRHLVWLYMNLYKSMWIYAFCSAGAQHTSRWEVQLRACTGPVLEKCVPPFIPPHDYGEPKRCWIAEDCKFAKMLMLVVSVILAKICIFVILRKNPIVSQNKFLRFRGRKYLIDNWFYKHLRQGGDQGSLFAKIQFLLKSKNATYNFR